MAGEGNFRWRNRAWNVISVTDRWVLQAGWWRSDGTEKRDYVLVEAEGMDGGATAVDSDLPPPMYPHPELGCGC